MVQGLFSTVIEDDPNVEMLSIDGDWSDIEAHSSENVVESKAAEITHVQDTAGRLGDVQSENRPQEKRSYSMGEKLNVLESAVTNTRPPYCAGTVPLDAKDFILYYGKKESSRRIDFSRSVSNKALKHLFDTCDKETYGHNYDDLLNTSHRKAGKLDAAYFSTKIDVERSGLMDAVRYDLLARDEGRRPIKADLHQMNVYGKGSFSKAHKDTLRSMMMFGCLVIVLPTPHEDGALILRRGENIWIVDSAKSLAETPVPHLHIAYIAFFSDVEHAVIPISSGYRVTLKYHLYYGESPRSSGMVLPKTLPANEFSVKSALRVLLEDGRFLPKGGHLGFALSHEYPIENKPKEMNMLDFIAQGLKGSDALLVKACMDFELDVSLNVVYQDELYGTVYEVIVSKAVNLERHQLDHGKLLWEHLKDYHGAKLVNIINKKDWDHTELDFRVYWVSRKTPYNALNATYIAHGNQVDIGHACGRFCLIVKVGPRGNRATVEETAEYPPSVQRTTYDP